MIDQPAVRSGATPVPVLVKLDNGISGDKLPARKLDLSFVIARRGEAGVFGSNILESSLSKTWAPTFLKELK